MVSEENSDGDSDAMPSIIAATVSAQRTAIEQFEAELTPADPAEETDGDEPG